MAVRDARRFKLIFQPQGVIDRFRSNKQLAGAVVEGFYFAKKPTLLLLRFILPAYRSYEDDDTLVEKLYENKTRDPYIRQLTNPEAPPILSNQTHDELDHTNNLPAEQSNAAQQQVVEKITGIPPQPVEQVAQEVKEEEKKEEGGPPQIPRRALEELGKTEQPPVRIPPRPSVPATAEAPPISAPRAGGVLRGLGSGLSRGAGGLLRAGGGLGGRLGGLAAQGTVRGLTVLGGAVVGAVGWPVIVAVLVVIIAIPLLFLIFNLFSTSTQCPPYQPNCGAPQVISASTLPPPGSTDPDAPYVPAGGRGLISCPVNSGIITNGSKERGGHCSPSYEAEYGVCARPGAANYRGKETAIDVISFDQVVYVPFLQGGGNPQIWTADEVGTPIAEYEGGGIAVGLNVQAAGHNFRVRFVHLSSTPLRVGDRISPGTVVGQYSLSAKHVHITLQEDGVYKPADLYFNLCQ